MANQIPEKIINFRVYREGTDDLLGVADVTLPSLDPMTDTVKGAGIAGEVETPTLGHYKSMTVTLKWRTVTASYFKLIETKVHHLDVRGALQVQDAGEGTYTAKGLKVVIRGTPKKSELGKLEVGGQQDASTEIEVAYIKITLDGADVLELDKFNFVNVVSGTDVTAGLRDALGLS